MRTQLRNPILLQLLQLVEIKLTILLICFSLGCETEIKDIERNVVEKLIKCFENDTINENSSCYSSLVTKDLLKKIETKEFIETKEELRIILKEKHKIIRYSKELKEREGLFEINCENFSVYVLIIENKDNVYFQVKEGKISSFYPLRKGSTVIGWL